LQVRRRQDLESMMTDRTKMNFKCISVYFVVAAILALNAILHAKNGIVVH